MKQPGAWPRYQQQTDRHRQDARLAALGLEVPRQIRLLAEEERQQAPGWRRVEVEDVFAGHMFWVKQQNGPFLSVM